ncbi:MAG: glycosyl hydrolase family protein, partial [Caldilineae bacterium]
DDRIAYSDSTGYQYVQLPAGVNEIVLQAKVWRTAAGQGNDLQYLLISAGSQSYTAFRSRVNETAWQEVHYDLTHLAGQRIRVLFGAFNTGGEGRVAMYVDDAAIYACTGGTATPTPAASPSPTASPVQGMPLYLPILQRPGAAGPETTPTVTPTPGPSCTEAVVNGGFEANGGWTMPTTARPARYASERVWQGSRSLRLGIPPGGGNARTDSTAYQWVNLPADAATITLTAHVWRGGGSSGDFHYIWVTAGGKTDRLLQGMQDARRWQEVTYDLTPLAGQRIFLLLGTFNDGVGGPAVMYVDEVSIQACPPNVTPTPPTPTPTPTATPIYAPPATVTSPDFGANAFLWWRPEIAERDLTLMKAAGFRWVRQSFMWEDMEQHGKGQFTWENADRVVQQVNASGLSLLARLGTDPARDNFWAGAPPDSLEDFVDFVAALARRYNCTPEAVGCIQAYQVWNEPNLAREWGGHRPNPRQYVTMLGQVYAAIKTANPNAIVITAGMAPTGTDNAEAMPDVTFYREMYRAMGGDSDGYFDLLGVHGAGFAAPPETDPAEAASNPAFGGHRFFSFRHVEDIRAIMVANGDHDKRMAVLEFGWTSDPVNPEYYWHGAGAGIDEFVKADYLKRAYIWAAEHWQP